METLCPLSLDPDKTTSHNKMWRLLSMWLPRAVCSFSRHSVICQPHVEDGCLWKALVSASFFFFAPLPAWWPDGSVIVSSGLGGPLLFSVSPTHGTETPETRIIKKLHHTDSQAELRYSVTHSNFHSMVQKSWATPHLFMACCYQQEFSVIL